MAGRLAVSLDMPRFPARFRNASVLVLTLLGLAATVAWTQRTVERRELQAESQQAREQLRLYADTLRNQIDRYRTLPAVLALDPELRAALAAPLEAAQRERLSRKLEQVNGVTRSSTLTLIDRRGDSVAASNWRLPNSNVGQHYSFRPYFRQAVEHGSGRFYGIGVTTGEPGYFLSEALRGDDGALLGVVVIKLDLRPLEREWAQGRDVVLVADEHEVAFLANRPDWRYRELSPLDPAERRQLSETRQYSRQPLRPLAWRHLETTAADSERVSVEAMTDSSRSPRRQAREYLWLSLPLAGEGWTLHLLRDTGAAKRAAWVAAAAAGGAWLSLVLLALFVQGRRRLSRLRLRSREELEQMVRQHALALRNAQDGVVLAAERAALGQAQSLEHLPQGVSIVDAELRLVAWNRRYVEIFRYPAEMMRAGRPIEDLLRYNGARGLLGDSDVETAIQRRLEHLRAGRAYLYEREWADGTVLEIRGNPLPGGGFVTSFADITSYKNTARELRTLAGVLERRVEQRTQDLEVAKGEAERANRSKTRFVAAAVHDLLQPLNAARMFVSALQGRLPDAATRQLADNVESALAAQDAILSSLLDIARLESGTIETEVRDLRLQPLFDALSREFGVMATARGLELRCVPTRAVVRSDAALLRRILQNFLANALRYTPRGRVLLGCRRAGAELRIEVWDTGPGIPEHRQQEIFEEFRRLDTAQDPAEQGAGLGLAIVDRIARRLDHRIGLRSWPGRGSVFSVSLPLGDPAALAAPEPASPPVDTDTLAGRRLCCIDDDPRVREGTRALLERWGCRVTLAAGLDEALAQRGEPPELLLLDYRLGERRGPDLLPALFAHWGATPPVILVSAERDPALQAQAAASGWGFLAKPVRPAALRALITQRLAAREDSKR